MTNGYPFCVVQKAIEEVTDMFTGYAEEILAFVTIRFVGSVGIVILGHDKVNRDKMYSVQ